MPRRWVLDRRNATDVQPACDRRCGTRHAWRSAGAGVAGADTAFGRTGEYPRATVCERHTTGGPRSDSRSRFECSTGPWVDRCAYVSSTGGVFPIIGILQGDEALLGVAVIDVSNPQSPKTVELLRHRGSIAATEAMHAVSVPGRKVLAAGAYHGGANAAGSSGSESKALGAGDEAWLDIYDVSDCANPKLMAELAWPENSHTIRVSPDGRFVYGTAMNPFTGRAGYKSWISRI